MLEFNACRFLKVFSDLDHWTNKQETIYIKKPLVSIKYALQGSFTEKEAVILGKERL